MLNEPHPASTQFPIHCAAEFDALNVTKFLCENVKVNPNVTDKDGKHALHYAANNLSYQVLEYLVNGNGFREAINYRRIPDQSLTLRHALTWSGTTLVKIAISKSQHRAEIKCEYLKAG